MGSQRTRLFILLVLLACESRAPEPTAESFLREARVIELEESLTDPMVAITDMAVTPDGGIVVVDGRASRIHRFDSNGRLLASVGRPGEGPGELAQPTAIALDGDTIYVVERGSPRMTAFAAGTAVSAYRLPGQYGFWLALRPDGFVVGVGTQDARFAILARDGRVRARFGRRDPRIVETPYWIFFVREHAAMVGDRILINTSFDPLIRAYDMNGDSINTFGSPPPDWISATPPPPTENVAEDSRQTMIAGWSRSFDVVTQMAVVADTLLVVGYGRHDPSGTDPDAIRHESIDVYRPDGRKILEAWPFPWQIVAGGNQLYVVKTGPPWRIAVLEWAEE